MPSRDVVTGELAKLFGVLSHPHRIRIIEELRHTEMDVKALEQELGISHSRVSQQLGQLRNHDLVKSRRDGRHVYYSLVDPDLARWLLEGLEFIMVKLDKGRALRSAVEEVRDLWLDDDRKHSEQEKNT